MNSLSFLSRQLDATASRSTSLNKLGESSTSQHNSNHSGSDSGASNLKRSKTWSKPLFFRRRVVSRPVFRIEDSDEDSDNYTARGGFGNRKGKRSASSPALFNHNNNFPTTKATTNNTNNNGNMPPLIPTAPSANSLILKDSYLYRRLHRLYLVRALAAVWNCLCATYEGITLRPLDSPRQHQRVRVRKLQTSDEETTSSADERESDDEMLHMSPVTRAPPTTNGIHLAPPPLELVSSSYPPASNSTLGTPPAIQHANELLPLPPRSIPSPSGTPPSSGMIRRQTPFHLPKTLVLDLDETLIHSTSRPMDRSSSSSGLFGLRIWGERETYWYWARCGGCA